MEILKGPWGKRKSAFCSALLELYTVVEVYTVRMTVQGEIGSIEQV